MLERTLSIAAGALAIFASDLAGPAAAAQGRMITQQAAQKTPTGSMVVPRVGWESTKPRGPQIKSNTQPRKTLRFPKTWRRGY